jgi:hypothetical protein
MSSRETIRICELENPSLRSKAVVAAVLLAFANPTNKVTLDGVMDDSIVRK